MTTKMKEGVPTKEKRGTSPSYPPNKDTIQRGKSLRPNVSKQAPTLKRSNSASPSGRNVPNYLKGTASSGPESSSALDHGKKPSPNDTLKPAISRRKSLDKPLPPSHVPKTRVSAITKETKKQPSSPSNARATSASGKPLSGRLSKARSFSEEKTTSRNHVKKVENDQARGLSTKDAITETVDSNHVHDIAPKKENALPQTESLVENHEDLDASVSQTDPKDNDDTNKEVIVLEDNNSTIDTDTEIEVEEVKIDESSITSKDKNESIDSIEDVPQENLNEEQGELEQHISTNMEESSLNEVEANASEEKEVEEVPINEESKEKEEEEVKSEGSDDVETKALETSVKKDEEKKEKQQGVAMKQQVVHGKREAVVSNDAIEETATKLREQRVNRVKALAGAFESVMS